MTLFQTLSFRPRHTVHLAILAALACQLTGCDGTTVGGCTCMETPSAWFDSLDIPSVVGRSDTIRAKVVVPAGCAEFDRVEQLRQHDTLWLVPAITYLNHSKDTGVDCAHGQVSVPVGFRLDSTKSIGSHWIHFPQGRASGTSVDSTPAISVTVR
jgi:hypothetical protein